MIAVINSQAMWSHCATYMRKNFPNQLVPKPNSLNVPIYTSKLTPSSKYAYASIIDCAPIVRFKLMQSFC